MTYKNYKLSWRKNYGDGEITDDLVLWANGEPTGISISGAECGWYGVLVCNGKELAMADTRKDLKDLLFTDFTKELDKELSYIK